MSKFDPARPLVMGKFKTVLGHSLTVGTALVISDEPAKPGEVDAVMAERLLAGGVAVYADEFLPTPVEGRNAEARRLLEAEKADLAVDGDLDAPLTVQADLHGTNAELRKIAADENIAVEGDDNKADLQRKIMEGRAARAESDVA